MPFRNRGYSRTNSRQGQRLPSVGQPSRLDRVRGAIAAPQSAFDRLDFQPFPPPPPDWFGPVTEWNVYYDLTALRKFQPDVDFLYQAAVPARGLNSKGFERSDFWILPAGKNGNPAGALYPQGVLINPISFFTHQSPGKDKIERGILANNGFLEIFLDEDDVLTRPHAVVGLALSGIDVSSRSE